MPSSRDGSRAASSITVEVSNRAVSWLAGNGRAYAFGSYGMEKRIQDPFERARQCYAQAHATSDKQAKHALQQVGDQLLKEAHNLAHRNPIWAPERRKPRTWTH